MPDWKSESSTRRYAESDPSFVARKFAGNLSVLSNAWSSPQCCLLAIGHHKYTQCHGLKKLSLLFRSGTDQASARYPRRRYRWHSDLAPTESPELTATRMRQRTRVCFIRKSCGDTVANNRRRSASLTGLDCDSEIRRLLIEHASGEAGVCNYDLPSPGAS
jgi:hypothetical protein